jgi:hypothetical protein
MGLAENPVEIGSKKDSVGLQTHDTKLNTSGMFSDGMIVYVLFESRPCSSYV